MAQTEDAVTTAVSPQSILPGSAGPATPSSPQHLQFVYYHFYAHYPDLHLLPQYYEDLFVQQGRLPGRRWLDFYNERLVPHEGAFYHLYEWVHDTKFRMNDLITTGPLEGMAAVNPAVVDVGAERVQVYARLGLMFGDMFLARGDYERSFRCYDMVVRMTRLRDSSPLLLHLLSLQLRQLAYDHMALGLEAFAGAPAGTLSPDVQAIVMELRDSLASYRPIEEQHTPQNMLQGELQDLWAALNAYDPPARPLPEGTLRQGWRTALERWQPAWESGRVPDELQLASGSRRYTTLMNLREEADRLIDDQLFLKDFSAGARRDILQSRITTTQAFWKLIYLEAMAIVDPASAGVLSELKKNIPPDLYPYMLLDPFTGLVFGVIHNQPGARSHYYSFGPDRDDDAGAVKYNPESGLTSDGDIVLFN
ncbi:MAG: hypothetical protein Kow0059_02310 [Candidatus Sumerlaeia bacterium]